AEMARVPAASLSLPAHRSLEFEAPERFALRDESCRLSLNRGCFSLVGPRQISPSQVLRLSISAGTSQWLWRFSAISFPLRIRKSGRRVRFRRSDLPLVRPSAPRAYPCACPVGLPAGN